MLIKQSKLGKSINKGSSVLFYFFFFFKGCQSYYLRLEVWAVRTL